MPRTKATTVGTSAAAHRAGKRRRPTPAARLTVDDVWLRFERWVKRYTALCRATISEFYEDGYIWPGDSLFIRRDDESVVDFVASGWPEDLALLRVEDKAAFLRAYLVEVSFDGAEFMLKNSAFLPCQYPSRCNNAYGFWFHQDPENLKPGGSFWFQGDMMSLFCRDPSQVDFTAVHVVLPFETMVIRRPRGRDWDEATQQAVLDEIERDMSHDMAFTMKVDAVFGNRLYVSFQWPEPKSRRT
jgi:hypothetical protein